MAVKAMSDEGSVQKQIVIIMLLTPWSVNVRQCSVTCIKEVAIKN